MIDMNEGGELCCTFPQWIGILVHFDGFSVIWMVLSTQCFIINYSYNGVHDNMNYLGCIYVIHCLTCFYELLFSVYNMFTAIYSICVILFYTFALFLRLAPLHCIVLHLYLFPIMNFFGFASFAMHEFHWLGIFFLIYIYNIIYLDFKRWGQICINSFLLIGY